MIDLISCVDAWYRTGRVLFSQDPYLSSPEQHIGSLSSIFWGTMDINSGEVMGGANLSLVAVVLGDEAEQHLEFLIKANLIVIDHTGPTPMVSVSEQGNILMSKIMEASDNLTPFTARHYLH
jgi:uracil DNA glycosylase